MGCRSAVFAGSMACLLLGSGLAGPGTAVAADIVATDVRVGQQADGRTRFVLELTKQAEFRVFTLADPSRVVIVVVASSTLTLTYFFLKLS